MRSTGTSPPTQAVLMHGLDIVTSARPPTRRADIVLILEQIVQCKTDSAVTPEARFLALLAIHRPSGLTRTDIERLASVMIVWGQRHIEGDARDP